MCYHLIKGQRRNLVSKSNSFAPILLLSNNNPLLLPYCRSVPKKPVNFDAICCTPTIINWFLMLDYKNTGSFLPALHTMAKKKRLFAYHQQPTAHGSQFNHLVVQVSTFLLNTLFTPSHRHTVDHFKKKSTIWTAHPGVVTLCKYILK